MGQRPRQKMNKIQNIERSGFEFHKNNQSQSSSDRIIQTDFIKHGALISITFSFKK